MSDHDDEGFTEDIETFLATDITGNKTEWSIHLRNMRNMRKC